MYAIICTRPNIAYVLGVLSILLSNSGNEHWKAMKWMLRHLRGISKRC